MGKPPGPPIADLAKFPGGTLSIVLYPSGPCLELAISLEGDSDRSRIAYSERLENINLAAKVLKERNP